MVEEGLVIAPRGFGGRIGPIRVLESDHPLPTRRSLQAAEALIEFVSSLPRSSTLLFLVSGGGSALAEKPCISDIGLVAEITRKLMNRGASIHELNTVRSILSCIKAGGLLAYTSASKVVNIVMSDVVGDNPCFIASGPTIPGCVPRLEEAEAVLQRYGLTEFIKVLRQSIARRPQPRRTRTETYIVARNLDALRAANKELGKHGYQATILTDRMRGEAREVAALLAGVAERLEPGRAVLIGGETQVTVRGNGIGGRNQELCLAMLWTTLSLGEKPSYTAACLGTDGVDGASPAAGAIVDGIVAKRALDSGLSLRDYLANNDSYSFFAKVDAAIDTGGYTGINVNDMVLIVKD